MYACQGPLVQPLPNTSWMTSVTNPSQTLAFAFGAVCGDLSVNLSTTENFAQGEGAAYVFDPPAGTTVSGYAMTGSADVDFATGGPHPEFSAGIRETTAPLFNDIGCVAVDVDCTLAPAEVTRVGLALTRLEIGVYCADAVGCPDEPFTNLSAALSHARVDVDDPTAPQIASVAGTLPGSSGAASEHSVNVTATDVGGGVASVALGIDGRTVRTAASGGSCGEPYTLRQPCPSGVTPSLGVDTADLADGAHTATVTAIDAAGNVSAPASFSFTVNSGGAGPRAVNGSPAVTDPSMQLDQSTLTTKSSRSVTISGVLTTAQGVPIAGASLETSAIDLGIYGAQEKPLGSVVTDASGRFSLQLRPDGARRVNFSFRPAPGAGSTASASAVLRENLALTIRRSKARVKPRGRLRLSGRLLGAGGAAGGAPVEIDVRIGRKWRAVGVVETSSRGSWKWRYRFTRVNRPTRFIFRAAVRRTASWPWPTELSRTTRVVVAR